MSVVVYTLVAGTIIGGLLVWIWADLTADLTDALEHDLAPVHLAPPAAKVSSAAYRPRIATLVELSGSVLVTPRGVEIPAEMLGDDFDLGDALDYLDYVEALG